MNNHTTIVKNFLSVWDAESRAADCEILEDPGYPLFDTSNGTLRYTDDYGSNIERYSLARLRDLVYSIVMSMNDWNTNGSMYTAILKYLDDELKRECKMRELNVRKQW